MSLEKQIVRLKRIRRNNLLDGFKYSAIFIAMALIFGIFTVSYYKIETKSYHGTYQTAYLQHFGGRSGYKTIIRLNDGMEFICSGLSRDYDEFVEETKVGAEVYLQYHPWFIGCLVDELIVEDKEYVSLEESMNLISSNRITLTVITSISICLTICVCTLTCVFGYRDEIKDCKKLIKHYEEKITHKMKK